MTNHVTFALFIHTPETEHLSREIQANPFSSPITPLSFELLIQNPEKILDGVNHLVISGSIDTIKKILELAIKFNFSVGILPMSNQKDLIRCYALPRKIDEAIDLALQKSSKVMDLILCNGQIMLFKTTIGRLPLMDSPADIGLNLLIKALKQFKSLELIRFDFTPADGKRIRTMACGTMIIRHHEGTSDQTNTYSSYLATRFMNKLESIGGKITESVKISNNVVDYARILETMRNKKTELLYLPVGAKDLLQIIKDLDKIGWKPKIFISDGLLATVLTQHKDESKLIEGIMATDFFSSRMPLTTFGKKALKQYRTRYDTPPNSYTVMGAEGYALLLNAMNRCPTSNDRNGINQMIRSTVDFNGITGKITIQPDGKAIRPLLSIPSKDGRMDFIVKVY